MTVKVTWKVHPVYNHTMSNYAFFDVDQTIYPGYSMADFYLSPAIISRGGDEIYKQDLEIGSLYKDGHITYAEAGQRAIQLCATTIKDESVASANNLASSLIQSHGLKDFVTPLFSLLHKHGYYIVLVSGSVEFLVGAIAKHSMADEYLSTTLVKDGQGIYTGEISHQMDNEEKKKYILKHFDLSTSHVLAFGDSTGDIPMISLADHGFFIDPHQREIADLINSHDNWHLTNENNILSQVESVI